jgi:TIR domain-containing protein
LELPGITIAVDGGCVATLFFSYSHVDESLRDLLETHLSGLRRQGLIESWHDRRIIAGEEFGPTIGTHIDTDDVILLLVSPDFIASDYCYQREMKRALERHQQGDARVIPVILRPCDWHDLPFGKLLATPKDGRPVMMWPNIDQAFLDVVAAIKRALKDLGQGAKHVAEKASTTGARSTSSESIRSSNLRFTKQFTDLDKDKFRHDGFEYIAKFFENSLEELGRRNPGLQQSFRRIDANRFTAAAYRDGEKVCRGSASLGGGTMGSESIEYSMTDEPRHGGMNEAVLVKTDDQMIYFEALGMQSFGNSKEKLTFQGAAELFWAIFMQPLQS